MTSTVVFVDTEMGREVGGAQTFLTRLLPALKRRGLDTVVVVSPDPIPPFASVMRAHGLHVYPGPWPYSTLVKEAAGHLARWVNSHTDVSYVVSVSAGIGWAALPMLRPDIPSLAICHNDADTFYQPIVHYAKALDVVAGVSRPILQRLEERGLDPNLLAFVPYGVEARPRRAPTISGGALRVAFIGRMEESQKALSVIRSAMALVSDLAIEFHFAGDGPDSSDFRRSVGQAKSARFYGSLDAPGVHALLDQVDCIVLASRYEGMPLVVLEAFSHGVVPVLSDIAPHTALVTSGTDGLHFPVDDPVGLADALKRLSRDRTLLNQLSVGAYATSERFSVSEMANAYETALHLASERRSSGTVRPQVPLMASTQSNWPLPARRAKAWARKLTKHDAPHDRSRGCPGSA